MRGMGPLRAAIRCLLVAGTVAAHAARPMITDDARIVDAKACQLETWMRRNVESTEAWALPACNPWGNAELTIGGGFTNAQGETHFTDQVLQVKTLFKPYEPGGWGVGIGVGTIRRLQRETARGWPGDAYFYV